MFVTTGARCGCDFFVHLLTNTEHHRLLVRELSVTDSPTNIDMDLYQQILLRLVDNCDDENQYEIASFVEQRLVHEVSNTEFLVYILFLFHSHWSEIIDVLDTMNNKNNNTMMKALLDDIFDVDGRFKGAMLVNASSDAFNVVLNAVLLSDLTMAYTNKIYNQQ